MSPGVATDALLRLKLLSSCVTKGRCGSGSSAAAICDDARQSDPEGFWSGYRFRLLGGQGQVVEESVVEVYDRDHGELRLATALARVPEVGQSV